MSNEELSKGIDAIVIALRDISLRLKELPEAPKGLLCPACRTEGRDEFFQNFNTLVMHVVSKHKDWIVIRKPGSVVQAQPPVFEHVLLPQSLSERLVPKTSVWGGLFGGKKEKPVERDWSKVAIGAVVVVVVLLVMAALLL